MCTTNIYTYVYPDGRREASEQAALCSSARHNKPCSNNVVFQHPHQLVHYTDGASGASPSSSYLAQFPPTPSYTPRSSTPAAHRSGDESDRSRRSSSSSHRRASIYINGHKAAVSRHDVLPSSRRERIILVDGPPTPRTPPQSFDFPHTAPASPSIGSYLGTSPRESAASFSRRPVIVDERPRMERFRMPHHVGSPVERAPSPVRGSSSSSKRDSQTSLSSRDGRDAGSSSSRHSGDETDVQRRRREREERRAEKDREEEEERQRKMRLRIAKANAEINKRPPVPVPPAPVRASSFSAQARAGESGAAGSMDRLAQGVKGMTFEEERREEKARRLAEKQQQREEDEAQRQRLAERMMPRRRATVGPGSRRQRAVYDDGVYRWE